MPLRAPVPTVVTVHDLTFFDHPEWHERTQGRLLPADDPRERAPRAPTIVCVSRVHRATGSRAVAPPRATVAVARHGVDHDRFAHRRRCRARPRRCSPRTGSRRRTSRSSARSSRARTCPTLVAAFARLARDHPDLRLVLAGGDGWGVDRGRATRSRRAASRPASCGPGYVDDDVVPALFRRAEAVVYPSLEEGFGLPALEALACGAPLVTTAGSALAEVVGDAALLGARPATPTRSPTRCASVVDDPRSRPRCARPGPRAGRAVHVGALGRAAPRRVPSAPRRESRA